MIRISEHIFGVIWSIFLRNSMLWTLEQCMQPHPPFLWLWKCKATSKVKVFGLLLFMTRLNTKCMLDHKHCAPPDCDLSCMLCSVNPMEDLIHLFFWMFDCPELLECSWYFLGYFNESGKYDGQCKITLPGSVLHGKTFVWDLEYLEADEWYYFLPENSFFEFLEAALKGWSRHTVV